MTDPRLPGATALHGRGEATSSRSRSGTLLGRLRFGPDGILPAVIQDARDGRVLMLGFVSPAALARTVAEGRVVFYSRSRRRLWRKGETSGNELRLVSLAVDCDGDALLLQVLPAGPACHRGTRSCFDLAHPAGPPTGSVPPPATPGEERSGEPTDAAPQGFAWLDRLWETIVDRGRRRPVGSYTARLLADGIDRPARKVAEEAVEVLVAALRPPSAPSPSSGPPGEDPLAAEAADLLYHLLVLLHARGLGPTEVVEVLRRRHRGPTGTRGGSRDGEDATDPQTLPPDPDDDPFPRHHRR